MNGTPGPASGLTLLEGLLRNPATYEMAEAIPKNSTGRPRDHPEYMPIVWRSLIGKFRTSRQVEAELTDPRVWRFARHIVRSVFPADSSMWLPERPMNRWHYNHMKRRYLDQPEIHRRIDEIHTRHAVALARELGLLDPKGPGSWTSPDLSRTIYGDGTVIPPLFRGERGQMRIDIRTGERVQVRHDPDASLHVQGDGEEAFGNKFAIVSARTATDRVILAVRKVDGPGGEAAVALDALGSIAPHVPDGGIQVVTWDMALRGVHIDRVMREFGWLTVAKVPSKENRKRRGQKGGRRVPKQRLIEVRDVELPDGRQDHVQIFAKDGAPGTIRLDERGDEVFMRLEGRRTIRRRDRSGYRFYTEHRLPSEYGGSRIRVRLHGDETDKARRLNRAENLRAIPYGDPDFDRIYARRNDAESINRAIKDSLFIGRAHSVGKESQEADLLAFGHLTNSLTLLRHRERQRLKAA